MQTEAEVLRILEGGEWHDVNSLLREMGLPETSRRHLLSVIKGLLGPLVTNLEGVRTETGKGLNNLVVPHLKSWLRNRRVKVRYLQITKRSLLTLADQRGQVQIRLLADKSAQEIQNSLEALEDQLAVVPHGEVHSLLSTASIPGNIQVVDFAHPPPAISFEPQEINKTPLPQHLLDLERESIHIIREAVASASRPGMLFSLGKDSMVMFRLAEKAFSPGRLPFPLVNIDTRWKFQEMNRFRDWMRSRENLRFIHFINPDAVEEDINPFDHGSAVHTDVTKTQALRKVIDDYKFDFLFGGARRDEEISRAKERVFSVRDSQHRWNPRFQRPEFWSHYNTHLVNGQSMRVFPLSNWTEVDIWTYIEAERIPLVPLYFSKIRPVVYRDGALIMVDDDRFRLLEGELIEFKPVRFRSLGCYPLSGAISSHAHSVPQIIDELRNSPVSERSSRLIDKDRGSSMEEKKIDGYF